MNNATLNFIIQQLKILFIATVKTLKGSRYSVDVRNFPKTQSVKGTITVGNQGKVEEILKKLEKLLSQLTKIKPKDTISVSNLSDIPKTSLTIPDEITVKNPQEDVRINNLETLETSIQELLQAIKKIKLDPKIDVKAPQVTVKPADVHIPPYPKFPEIHIPEAELLISDDPKRSIPVRLTDGKKFYEAIVSIVGGVKQALSFSNSAGTKQQGLVDGSRHVVTASSDFWGLNNSEKSGNTTYLGEENTLGDWKVTKIVTSGTGSNKSVELTYATVKNNDGVTTYADAWDVRALLTYGTYKEAHV